MKKDIDKLADRLVKLGREGIAIETKVRELKTSEGAEPAPRSKAS